MNVIKGAMNNWTGITCVNKTILGELGMVKEGKNMHLKINTFYQAPSTQVLCESFVTLLLTVDFEIFIINFLPKYGCSEKLST
jgi:hypothetical protein